MKGYVKNMTPLWAHALKRAVGPGQKIPLNELYEQYGAKHNLKEGDEFIRWLKDVKLKDPNKWQVVFETTDGKSEEQVQEKKAVSKDKGKIESRGENVAPIVPKKMEVADVVGLSVRQAREILPTFTDLDILRYALSEANQLAGKDSLCRILRKRLQELEITRRR